MAGRDPLATETALRAGLPRSLSSTLREVQTSTFPGEHEAKIQFLRFELPVLAPSPDLSQALILVKRSLMPMSTREAVRLLGRIKAKTRRRTESDADIITQINVYAEDLADYPADVVRYVLHDWADDNDFFPTWAELVRVLRLWSKRRRALRDVLVLAETPPATDST